jgi:hypothetical protein
MEPGTGHRRRPRLIRGGRAVLVGLGLAAVGVVVAAGRFAPEPTPERRVALLQLQPVRKPPVTSADSAQLPDDSPVIGVAARNRHRAYAISAFGTVEGHVVNDVVGGAPITVAYCNRTGCTSVYTSRWGNEPIEVAVGGWAGAPGSDSEGVMLLRVGANYYRQDSGQQVSGWEAFPYPEVAFEHTTWGAWRKAHPDTDVVTAVRQAGIPAR